MNGVRTCGLSSTLAACLTLVHLTGCASADDPEFFASSETGFIEESSEQAPSALSCSLSPVVGDSGEISIQATLRNDGSVPLSVLKWDTPWDTESDVFAVTDIETGHESTHIDPAWRIASIAPEHAYFQVSAGEELSTLYPLSQFYALPTDSEVSLRTALVVKSSLSEGEPSRVSCSKVTVSQPQAREVGRIQQPLKVHSDCTQSQKDKINEVISMAQRVSSNALSTSRRLDSPAVEHLNQRWFGVITPSNTASGVIETWERIASSGATVRCGSSGSVCDGVNGSTTWDGRLYLCPDTWDREFWGMTSQSTVETLIHEVAHKEDSPFGQIVDWENPSCDSHPENLCYNYPPSLELATHCHLCARRNTDNYVGYAAEAYMVPIISAAL